MRIPISGEAGAMGRVHARFHLDSLSHNGDIAFISMNGKLSHDHKDGSTSELDGSMDELVRQSRKLTESIAPGYDFTREIRLTEELALGDTILLFDGDSLVAFAVCHSVPLVEGRVREELRVLKLVSRNAEDFEVLISALSDHARRSGTRRVALRMQGQYAGAYRRLMQRGARVRWSDLRMTLEGYAEVVPSAGIVLSNWEI